MNKLVLQFILNTLLKKNSSGELENVEMTFFLPEEGFENKWSKRIVNIKIEKLTFKVEGEKTE
jgi:hypothetical protein